MRIRPHLRRMAAVLALLMLVEAPLLAAPNLDLDPWRVASNVRGTVLNVGGAVVGTGGRVATGVVGEFGGAATQVYEDASGGKFLWVASPARQAWMVAPQVHTAARNSLAAQKHARIERAQQLQQTSRRLRFPHLRAPRFHKPVLPTRQVVARQFASPFKPSNMLFTVGATAVGGLIQAALDEDMTWRDAFGFVKDRSYWAGVAGSGVGYGVASLMALALLPAGGGLFCTLAPMVVGTVGSIIGWVVGAQLGEGKSFSEALESLSLAGIVGKSLGSALGITAGVTLGAALGGPVGAIAGPVGAVAGALVFRNLGQKWGEEAEGLVRPTDREAAAEGLLVPLDGRYRETYTEMVAALEAGDREAAALHLEELRIIAEQDGRARVAEATE